MEKGEEGESVFIAQHVVMSSIWRGDFANASLVAEDAMEQARQLGGSTPLFLAHSMRAPLAAFAGQEAETRHTIDEALEIGRRTGTFRLGQRLLATLAFLEVSLGNYEAAVAAVAPMLSAFDPESTPTELPGAAFLPDAIEALVQLGRLAEAEPLIEALERNGRTFDRPGCLRSALVAGPCCWQPGATSTGPTGRRGGRWPNTSGWRCRSTLREPSSCSDSSNVDCARRSRRRSACSRRSTLSSGCNVPLWADRARAELARANVGSNRTGQLTPSEQRVAELAASGMKNRDVANALFISPKTVEANLARIYRKLGIKSRAELGRHVGRG